MRSFPRGGGHLEAFGEYVSTRPALVRRLAVHAFVLVAGLFLLLARTSPALAADNNGQGKAQDHTSASAMMNRQDSPSASNQQGIGGGGDGKGNGGKGNGRGGPGRRSRDRASS